MLQQAEEKELAAATGVAKLEADLAIVREDFAAAMTAMAKLRPRVDAFFDKVTVNVDDKALRENRLKLLNEIREATRAVADFSKIGGKAGGPAFGKANGCVHVSLCTRSNPHDCFDHRH